MLQIKVIIIDIRTLFGINRITMYVDYITLNLSEPFPELLQPTVNGIQLNTRADTNCVYNILKVSNFRLKRNQKSHGKALN